MKKHIISYSFLLAGLMIIGSITSCKKDYLDINSNPNNPSDVTVVELLPSAQAAIAHVVGNHYQIYGGIWGQYWTQSPSSSQYKVVENYSPGANEFDRPWRILYSGALQDLSVIIEKSTAENRVNYIAVAKILQAYTFQLLTDGFGDIPFSDALQAKSDILSPHYNSQHDVYHGIIDLLKEADALIDENSEFHPHDEDMIFHGDMFFWRIFGNTLRLRAYLRLAYVDAAEAQNGIAELEASGAEFMIEGDAAQINYTTDGGNTNPLYSSIVGLSFVQNLVASATGMNFLLDHNDERTFVFYESSQNGSYVGIPQGAYNLPAGTQTSYPGVATGGYDDPASATAPVKLMTGYESLFLQAEAVARGWMSGDDQGLYETAIIDNFESYGLTNGEGIAYLTDSANLLDPLVSYPASGTMEDKIKTIITQKWIAMCGNSGIEGWTEWRRTGYPDFFVESANSIIGAGRFPARFFYPTDEVNRNANFPGQKLVYEKVWWDVN